MALASLYHQLNRELTLDNLIGQRASAWVHGQRWYTEGMVDTVSNNVYSIIVGTALDTGRAHLSPTAWLTSRGYATIMNTLTGAAYGKYRNFIYTLTRTTPESGKARKTIVDLLVFNTAQPLVYASAIALSTLIFEGGIDFQKVKDGALGLAMLSPIIAPTFNWTQDKTRELCGFKTAAEHATRE